MNFVLFFYYYPPVWWMRCFGPTICRWLAGCLVTPHGQSSQWEYAVRRVVYFYAKTNMK